MNRVGPVGEGLLAEQSGSSLDKACTEKGFRIARAAKIALHTLAASLAIGTAAIAFTACLVCGATLMPLVAVCAFTLCAVLSFEAIPLIKTELPEKVQHAINLVRATAIDILAKLTCAILLPFRQTLFDPKQKDCSADQTPILLVHGYLHNSSAWAYFRYRLKHAGLKNIFTVDLGNPFLSIERYASKVDKRVQEIRKATGRNDINLIGHSMGGVVCSYYATHSPENVVISSVTTLGSPLKGTHLKGLGKCAVQMRRRTDFLADLRKKMKESSVNFYHIGSKTDLIVLPCSSTVIKRHKHELIEDLGHVSYLFSDRVIRKTIQNLS